MRRKNPNFAVLAQVRPGLAFLSFYFAFFRLVSTRSSALAAPPRASRLSAACLAAPLSALFLFFLISRDRFCCAAADERETRGEVCGMMEREAANMRCVCFSSGFGFHPSLSSVIITHFSFSFCV